MRKDVFSQSDNQKCDEALFLFLLLFGEEELPEDKQYAGRPYDAFCG